MATDTLTAPRLRELLEYETGLLRWLVRTTKRIHIGDVAGCHNNGYLVIGVDGHLYGAHRLVWLHVHGAWPPHQLDHINGIRDDNRIENLRLATKSENMQNRSGARSDSKSGILGVHWSKGMKKWCASLNVNDKRVHLSYHTNIEDAIAARRAAEIEFHPFSNDRQRRARRHPCST